MTQATKKQVKRRNKWTVAVGKIEPKQPLIVWTMLDDKFVGIYRDDMDVDYSQPEVQ